jgi:hypothetical protein
VQCLVIFSALESCWRFNRYTEYSTSFSLNCQLPIETTFNWLLSWPLFYRDISKNNFLETKVKKWMLCTGSPNGLLTGHMRTSSRVSRDFCECVHDNSGVHLLTLFTYHILCLWCSTSTKDQSHPRRCWLLNESLQEIIVYNAPISAPEDAVQWTSYD